MRRLSIPGQHHQYRISLVGENYYATNLIDAVCAVQALAARLICTCGGLCFCVACAREYATHFSESGSEQTLSYALEQLFTAMAMTPLGHHYRYHASIKRTDDEYYEWSWLEVVTNA